MHTVNTRTHAQVYGERECVGEMRVLARAYLFWCKRLVQTLLTYAMCYRALEEQGRKGPCLILALERDSGISRLQVTRLGVCVRACVRACLLACLLAC